LSVGQGVFMHDIVRDYVIHQHSEEELRALQRSVVEAILAARPEPGGFPTSEFAVASTFEGYVARQLFWHMQRSLDSDGNGIGGREALSEKWLTHPDKCVKMNTAMAVGLEAMNQLSADREKDGKLVHAAHFAWGASLVVGQPEASKVEFIYRAAGLLERADDESAIEFEEEVLSIAFCKDMQR